uniref:(northern house mosquito) hypothetical protein n=1 Tax=Culex pipiens TaxID=7175 RepID=A0A8D8JM45_CULPI
MPGGKRFACESKPATNTEYALLIQKRVQQLQRRMGGHESVVRECLDLRGERFLLYTAHQRQFGFLQLADGEVRRCGWLLATLTVPSKPHAVRRDPQQLPIARVAIDERVRFRGSRHDQHVLLLLQQLFSRLVDLQMLHSAPVLLERLQPLRTVEPQPQSNEIFRHDSTGNEIRWVFSPLDVVPAMPFRQLLDVRDSVRNERGPHVRR